MILEKGALVVSWQELECIIFGTKSLEHVVHGGRRINPVKDLVFTRRATED